MGLARRMGMAVLLALMAADAGAQFGQYTPPGGPGTERVGVKEELERSLEEARWRLGPIRVAPWFGIRQIGWVEDVFAGSTAAGEKVSDLTATGGAGISAYLPTGPDVVWTVEAHPEYVWWRDLAERRQFTGRYGAGVFGFFNRLDLQITAGRDESQGLASSEFPQLTVTRNDRLAASGGLRLSGKIDLAFSASWSEVSDRAKADDPRAPAFAALDRRERQARAALGYQVTRRVRVALGFEHTETDSIGARDLSNDGTAPTFDLSFLGSRTTADLRLAHRSLRPRGDSSFTSYRAWNGEGQFTVKPKTRLAVQLYGSVRPALSLLAGYTTYEERRLGLALRAPLSRRLSAALFAERGRNEYEALSGVASRRDDARSWGAQLNVALTRSLAFNLRASRDELTSSLPGFDRSTTSLQSGLTLASSRLLWR